MTLHPKGRSCWGEDSPVCGERDPESPAGEPGIAAATAQHGGTASPVLAARSQPTWGWGQWLPSCVCTGDAMQMTEDEKIMPRMLSTRLTDSCQNILPSSFITHHFQATAQHSDTILTGTLQYLQDSLINVKNVWYKKQPKLRFSEQ